MKNIRIALAVSVLCAAVGCGPNTETIGSGSAAGDNLSQSTAPITGGICPNGATVQGIDVSEFQGGINWGAVKASGRSFAIARVGDGYYQDPTFAGNWNGMKGAGLIRGAYQFFEPGEDAVAQANIVISKVGRLGAGDLPVMLDMEVTGGQSGATITAKIHQWVNAIAAGTGKAPFIYTGAYFWDDNVRSGDFAGLALNVAWYGTNCPGIPSEWHGWTMHQYTSSGAVPGIGGNVDLDVFNGDQAHLDAFAGQQSSCGGVPSIPPGPTGCGGLAAGQGLGPGGSVKSCDGRFELVMQGDGNAVVYSFGVPLWSSGTAGQGGYMLAMQGDGNLVVYSKESCALWSSHTYGHPGSTLAMQGDGNAVIYDSGRALWSSSSGGISAPPTSCGTIAAGQGLAPGESVSSCDGHHTLVMQGDGNFVLYHSGVATWSSRSNGGPWRHAVMQGDGNLVVYEQGGHPVWNSGTQGHPGTSLAIQDDGNLVLYDAGRAIWATMTNGR